MTPIDPGAGPWASRRSHPSSFLEMYVQPTVPTLAAISRRQPWESSVLLRSSGLNMWLNPSWGFYINFKILKGGYGNILVLQHLVQASYVNYLLYYTCHLPIWWCLPFFGLFLPTMYRASLRNNSLSYIGCCKTWSFCLSVWWETASQCSFNNFFLLWMEIEHLFIYLRVIHISFSMSNLYPLHVFSSLSSYIFSSIS